MSSSAINQSVFQAKVFNIQNVGDSSAVCSTTGDWSFKNATATATNVFISNAGNVGIGTSSPRTQTMILGAAQDTPNITDAGAQGGTLTVASTSNSGGAGGAILFAARLDNGTYTPQAAIKSFLTSGTSNGAGALCFSTRNVATDTSLTERGRIDASGAWTLGSTSGTTEVEHLISGYRTGGSSPALNIHNRSTSTACPAFNVIKGSADTTTGHRLATFTVNGGSNGAGQINVNGANACAFGSYSDRRLKENIVPLSGELSKVLALNPVEFDYIEGGHQVGFIAQEIEEIYPDAVSILGETEEMKMVTGWDKTTARLVKAIQELSAKVDAQAAEIEALKAK